MKLINKATELESEFKRLLKEYEEYYWTTAWASSSNSLFNELIRKESCIKKIIVGIHFYQTHPDFIEAFIDHKQVRFMQQPEGTFHPKLYLFFNDNNNWELLVGSANFTNEAFVKNTEACILLSNSDSGAKGILSNAFNLIETIWTDAKYFTKDDLEKYRLIWKTQKQKIKSLSGLYGGEKKSKPIYKIPVVNKSWDEFVEGVINESLHGVNRRLQVIELAQNLFENNGQFSKLPEDERKFIAGIPNKSLLDGAQYWPYFGSMMGAGIYKNRIKENDINISKALDQIPLSGQITKSHYDKFIKHFTKTFSGKYIATATRLLAMKRPDTFVCFDSKNKSALCKDFGIIQSEMSYERYWDDIIARIYDCNWWQNPSPKNQLEQRISSARAAFLDSLYYEE